MNIRSADLRNCFCFFSLLAHMFFVEVNSAGDAVEGTVSDGAKAVTGF